ncbi:hypothetical protein ACQ4PT_027626 [Festuca glaucescens]
MEPRHWSADKVRNAFLEYCTSKSYTPWPSGPVVRVDDPRPLFAPDEAVMDQLKLTSPVSPVFYTQRRISVGGANSELVGKETQTLREMCGTLRFGDENCLKEDAIKFSWNLLTEVYNLSPDRLYVTYFEADGSANVVSDIESKHLWLQYLPIERVSGDKDSAWKMGDTGPCGPCTKILYDIVGNRDSDSLSNGADATCVEICHIVFIQFNEISESSLTSLARQHIGTEMALENLSYILQNKTCLYDSDIFVPLFDMIYKKLSNTGIQPYSGKMGSDDTGKVDMAYRVIADHIRTLSFAIVDGSLPGNGRTEKLIRCLFRRALYFGRTKMKAERGFLGRLVQSDVLPALRTIEKKIKDLIEDEETWCENSISKKNGTFFCTRCRMLMRNASDIVEHFGNSYHRRFLVSTIDEQKLYCLGCRTDFSSITEAENHSHETEETGITIFCEELPPREGHGGELTPFVVAGEGSEMMDDVAHSSDEEIGEADEYWDWSSSSEESDDDDEPYVPPEKNDMFAPIVKCGLLDVYNTDKDNLDYLVEPRYKLRLLAHARTLKNVCPKAEVRSQLRDKYIIAEAVTEEVALSRVNDAISKYEKHGYLSRPARKIVFEPLLGHICLEKKEGFHNYSPAKSRRMYLILLVIQRLLKNKKQAIRENSLHYIYPSTFAEEGLKPDQLGKRIRKAVTEITLLLQIVRESLLLRPSPKGLISGDVQCYIEDKLLCDGTLGGDSGSIIPSEVDLISSIKADEGTKYVLVLEKDTIFHYLVGMSFPESESCILVCGKGHPDVATRILLRKLKDHFPKEIPFYCLVDCNPSGSIIYSTYCFGSEERSHDNIFLTVPELQFLGLFPSDVDPKFLRNLTESDLTKLENILAKGYLPNTETTRFLKTNLALMKDSGKVDLDVLMENDMLLGVIRSRIEAFQDEAKVHMT